MTAPHSTAFSTCDFCDAHKADDSGAFRVLPPVFQSYGGVAAFAGAVATVKCFEDNTLVKAAVDSPGLGRVLVVDGAQALGRVDEAALHQQRYRIAYPNDFARWQARRASAASAAGAQ